jgi:hypothetical protein
MEINIKQAYGEELYSLTMKYQEAMDNYMSTKDELNRLKDLLQTTGTNLIGTSESERLEIVRCKHCSAIKNIYQSGDVPHKDDCPVAKITKVVWEVSDD